MVDQGWQGDRQGSMSHIGIVVIGRNEGKRLTASLSSLSIDEHAVLYVDSGSSDGSPQVAADLGVAVLELDASLPMSASRARNEGLFKLMENHPEIEFVQFLDGDSMLCPGWLEVANAALMENEQLCAVTGLLKERDVDRSLIKQVCLVDYHLPEGEVHCFCGNSFVRVTPFLDVGGFNVSIPAGEEPELSQRLRAVGWCILSIKDEMAIHDSGTMTLMMWLRRAIRSGYAYAHVLASSKRGASGRFGLRQSLRIWCWTIGFSTLLLSSLLVSKYGPIAVMALLVMQWIRVGLSVRKSDRSIRLGFVYAVMWYLGLWAQLIGQIKFHRDTLTRRPAELMETGGSPAGGSKQEDSSGDSIASD